MGSCSLFTPLADGLKRVESNSSLGVIIYQYLMGGNGFKFTIHVGHLDLMMGADELAIS
jgi:hypothetical protein